MVPRFSMDFLARHADTIVFEWSACGRLVRADADTGYAAGLQQFGFCDGFKAQLVKPSEALENQLAEEISSLFEVQSKWIIRCSIVPSLKSEIRAVLNGFPGHFRLSPFFSMA